LFALNCDALLHIHTREAHLLLCQNS
jgi:hypothetical protein